MKQILTATFGFALLTLFFLNCAKSTDSTTPASTVAAIPVFSSLTLSTDISAAALDADSATTIAWLNSNGGWGGGTMRVDFSNHLLLKTSATTSLPIKNDPGYYSPDCDDGLTEFPMPDGGAIEGQVGYSCPSGDCHLLVVDPVNAKLYESFGSNVVDDSGVTKLQSICAIVWDLNKNYGVNIRGDNCASADSSGLPVAALLFTADEIASGSINHAIRFVLPNARIRSSVFVHPATHAGLPTGPITAPPLGARFRLKASFDTSTLKPAAKIVADAMKKYGMILVDGGTIALTASSDTYTTHKWSEVDFTATDLSTLAVTDFEMIDAGARIPLTYSCAREP